MRIVPFTRKISRPPGRRRRAASGIQRYGSHQMLAPYSLIARSNEASGRGTASALASMSGKDRPCSAWSARAVSSWAGVMSTPTGRAPRRASHAETYAVPQPSSIVSRPATSGRIRSLRLGDAPDPPARLRLRPTRADPGST